MENLTATPMFLRLINSMKLFPILCDASSERKISRWLRNFVELFPILCNASERQQTKMAAQKKQIHFLQLVHNIAGKIPTTMPTFSKFRNLMKLFSLLCYACEKQNFKIAALTRE